MTKEEKQKAIDALKISAPVMAITQYEFDDYIQTLNKVMDWLEEQEWISVKKHGKPKKSGKYWVTIQSTTSDVKWVRANEYHAERHFFDTEMAWKNAGIKITAWQPIIEPSPYKGE